MKFLFIGLVLSGITANAGLFELQNRPLRVLNINSEILVTVEGDLQAGGVYQDGKAVLIFDPSFDQAKPYCEVESFSKIPSFEDRKYPLKLNDIEGSVSDSGQSNDWTKFITKLQFSSATSRITITCLSDSVGSFKEITLGEFEKVFGPHLRFGNLLLGDSGIELQHPLYPEYYVLDAKALRTVMKLEVLQPINMPYERETNTHRVTIAGGKIIAENDYSQPYCQLLHIAETETAVSSELVLKAGQSLQFAGNVSGSYNKSNGWDFGFSFYANVVGHEKPLQLYCSSLNANQPLRYSGARLTTYSILGWIFSY